MPPARVNNSLKSCAILRNHSPASSATKRAPGIAFGVRRAILGGRFLDVAPPAEGLQVRHVPRVAAAVERDDVIALQSTGPAALPATKAIALEHPAPHPRPSPPVERPVIASHQPAIIERSLRRAFGGERTNEPAASTSAAATSSRA